jgi:hypothetical protein
MSRNVFCFKVRSVGRETSPGESPCKPDLTADTNVVVVIILMYFSLHENSPRVSNRHSRSSETRFHRIGALAFTYDHHYRTSEVRFREIWNTKKLAVWHICGLNRTLGEDSACHTALSLAIPIAVPSCCFLPGFVSAEADCCLSFP